MALSPTSSRGSTAGAGAQTLISSQVLGADAATIVIGSIPATYNSLRAVCLLRTTRASTGDTAALSFNADTTAANYIVERQLNNKGTASTAQLTATLGLQIETTAASITAGYFAVSDLMIAGYQNTTYFTHLNGITTFFDGTGGLSAQIGGIWKSSAVVATITLTPSVGPNFLAGSALYVYGVT